MNTKLWCCALAAAGFAASAQATPFDNSTGTTATAVVDSGGSGDYLTLAAASQAFDAVTGGINRPWILSINSNLSEAANSTFGNNFGAGASLTIKPNGVRTITFTGAPTGQTSNGHLLIGYSALSGVDSTKVFASTSAYTIDGSSTVNGTSRDLTFQDSTGSNQGNVIRIVGRTDGLVIKNLNVIGKRNGSENCIAFGGGNISGFGDMVSLNALIQNCYLQSTGGNSSTANTCINYSNGASGTLTASTTFSGHQFLNNTLVTWHRGITVLYSSGFTASGNTISVRNPFTAAASSWGIGHAGITETPASPYTVNITNNLINDLATSGPAAAGSLWGIEAVGNGSATYNINNNVVTGVKLNGSSLIDAGVRGIGAEGSGHTYVIEHNSVNLAAQSNIYTTATTVSAGIDVNATQAGTAVRNNIIRTGIVGTNSAALIVTGATPTAANIVGNDIFTDAGVGNVAVVNGTNYATYGAFTGAGFNGGGGQNVDPAATTPAWNTSDLSFPSTPAGLGTVASSTVLKDINNQNRPATGAYPGAYRIVAPAGINEWSLF